MQLHKTHPLYCSYYHTMHTGAGFIDIATVCYLGEVLDERYNNTMR